MSTQNTVTSSDKREKTSQEAVSPPEDKSKRPASSEKRNRSRRQRQNNRKDDKRPEKFAKQKDPPPQQMRYLPKLMLEETADKKEVLVKIGSRTSTRQVINYALTKIKEDWKVTFNAFRMEMTKALQATEIIKTRIPFLHQENRLISYTTVIQTKNEKAADDESKEGEGKDTTRISSGISITLSRNLFEITDQAGYQRPKPRQFMQPLPKRSHIDERAKSAEPEKDLRQRKQQKKNKKKSQDSVEKVWEPKKMEEQKGKKKRKNNKEAQNSRSEEREERHFYYERRAPPYYEDEGRFPPRHQMMRGDSRRMMRGRGSFDYDRDPRDPRGFHQGPPPGFRRMSPGRQDHGGFRRGPPPQHFRGGPRGPPHPYPRQHFGRDSGDFEVPERPGYYAGNRQFRMDKIRDQPLEKVGGDVEKDRKRERDMKMRDQRNRPTDKR